MRPNFFLTARERGKIVARREAHNVWTDFGREYLRTLISLQNYSPDTPIEIARPKYLQFGVGGSSQSELLPTDISDAYPSGEDPHATNGRSYSHRYPIQPNINTLERPIRLSGSDTPYPGDPGDVWLSEPEIPKFFVSNPTPTSVALRWRPDIAAGDYVYSPFTVVPISEAGIVLSSGDPTAAYNDVVAYINFSPLELQASLELDVTWIISF